MANYWNKLFFGLLLLGTFNCSPKWTRAIKCGEVKAEDFTQSIDIEVVSGLIIIPVHIEGEEYRFLFDSGAPTSISNALQAKLEFRTISHGRMVDSEHNKEKIKYVRIERLDIADIPFTCQTAFVGDFVSNPAVKCLQIDGIIGSNLMRFCNWKIDYQKEEVTFSNLPANRLLPSPNAVVSFDTDKQFDILVDISAGGKRLRNVEIDYGSNGGLILPSHSFELLKKNKVFSGTFSENGVSQSGLLGVVHDIKREVGYLDTLRLAEEIYVKDVEVKSNGFGLIGSKLLSQFVVAIDWEMKHLLFEKVDHVSAGSNFGFHVGQRDNGELYVQSVVDASPAYTQGVRPDMKLLQMNGIDFVSERDFCDFMHDFSQLNGNVTMELLDHRGQLLIVELKISDATM